MSTTTVETMPDTYDSATWQYLMSEDGGHKFRTVAMVDTATRERIESEPVRAPYVRMFGRVK